MLIVPARNQWQTRLAAVEFVLELTGNAIDLTWSSLTVGFRILSLSALKNTSWYHHGSTVSVQTTLPCQYYQYTPPYTSCQYLPGSVSTKQLSESTLSTIDSN